MKILFVPTIVLPDVLLLVFVRSDVNVVFPIADCELGDGGIATLVTIFSVPSVAANINHIHTYYKTYKAYLKLILTYIRLKHGPSQRETKTESKKWRRNKKG
jgi:hypothetical protein